MKMLQGAEIPDELVFREVAEANLGARVTIATVESIRELLDCMYHEGKYNRRKRNVWWRRLFRNRRKA